LAALRETHPTALLAALGDDGFRVPMPVSVGARPEYTIPLPLHRVTMVDLVVPADRIAVVSTWERALRNGIGVGFVHLPNNPTRAYSLSIIDDRAAHGVWIGALTDGGDAGSSSTEVLAGSLVIPTRPRTATMHKTMLGVITSIDHRMTEMLGWSAEQMVGHRSNEFMHPDDEERAISAWMQMLSSFESQRVRVRHQCADGTWLWVEIENTYLHDDDPEAIDVVCQVSDIADEMAAHQALHQREQLFHRLAESLPTGVFQVGAERSIAYVNGRLGDILGVASAATVDEQWSTVIEEDRPAVATAMESVLADGTESELEVGVRLPETGELRRCTMSFVAIASGEETPGALVCVNDVTDSARMREELEFKATFDALTGCYNQSSVMTLLGLALAANEHPTAVIFVDLDNFKPVNDQLGHAVGDKLLVEVARRFRLQLRDRDSVGRIGGDEFLLVCPGIEDADQALAVAERVRHAFDDPVTLTAGTVALKASIGLACSERGINSDTLVARADAAMYVSKREGKGRAVTFEPSMLDDADPPEGAGEDS
jgi:diguanylate cyclase (GGDEF)-like protein/PAS domain S-box-containing protein